MNKEQKRKPFGAMIYWFLTFGYMGAIYYLSSLHFIDLPRLPEHYDKILHACLYIPLAFLVYRAFSNSGMKQYVFIPAFLLACIYGMADEFHQSFVPGRIASTGDMIADFIGAFIGSIGASFIK